MSRRHTTAGRAGRHPARHAARRPCVTAMLATSLTVAAGLCAPAALAGTGALDGPKPPPGQAKPDTPKAKPAQMFQVAQKNLSFNPTELKVNTGDTVTWTNREGDDTTHSVVQGNGADIDSPDIQPGQTFVWKFDFPGEWDIVCRFHPDMFLTINVAGTAVPGAKHPDAPAHTEAPAPAKPTDGSSTVPGVTGLPITFHHPHARH
jgi:plastocyanin